MPQLPHSYLRYEKCESIVENGMELPQKTKNRATIWSCNPTPGHIPGKMKSVTQKGICTPGFIAATVNNSQDREATWVCINRWMDKDVVYIYTLENYSSVQKNEIMPSATTWTDLEIIILSEVSQKEKDKYHMISHMWNQKHDTNESIYCRKHKQTHRHRKQT